MSGPPPSPEELAAKAAAAKQFNIEAFTLLGVGLFIIVLRTCARILTVGIKRLQVDDFLVWLAAICYAAETALAYSVGNAAQGLANNGMTSAERSSLRKENPEYGLRVLGSKIQLGGWTSYGVLLWSLKGSLLVFYTRLTAGLGRNYELRIRIGYGFVAVSWIIVTLNLYLGCRPFHRNWQIDPDPGNVCQPAVSDQVIWTYLMFNVTTDMYLLSIPLPMLWKASLRPLKKAGLMFLFGGGIFVIACATLRCVLIVTDPINGAQLAGSWAVRETFVAVVTTNLPMVYPLFNILLAPFLSTWGSGSRSAQKLDERSDKLATLGARGPDSKGLRTPRKNPLTNVTFSESEERMMGIDAEAHDLKPWSQSSSTNGGGDGREQNIQKQIQVTVSHQDREEQESDLEQQQRRAVGSIEIGDGKRRSQGHSAFVRGPSPAYGNDV